MALTAKQRRKLPPALVRAIEKKKGMGKKKKKKNGKKKRSRG